MAIRWLNLLLIAHILISAIYSLEKADSSNQLDQPEGSFQNTSNLNLNSSKESTGSNPLGDIIYDIPDLTAFYYTEKGDLINLKGFKTQKNDELIKDPAKHKQLRWVSLGRPRLKEVASFQNQQKASLFHLDSAYQIVTYFEMLTAKDKQVLKDYVKQTRNITVDTASFIDITPNPIKCSVKVFNEITGKIVILNGKAADFYSSPYEISFEYVRNSEERKLFEKAINASEPLNLECAFTIGAETKRSNVFSITLQQSNSISLVDNLFGPADSAYVTRNQTSELANEVYTKLNVLEDYQVSSEQFDKDFVNDLVTLVGSGAFEPVAFDDALKSLSKYSLQFEGDLKPDVIKKEMENFFKLEKLSNKSRIVFDTQYYEKLEDESQSSGKGSASVKVFGLGNGKASASYAQSQSHKWETDQSSLSDQLFELNTYSESDFQYEFQGEKIIPKSIKVAKIQSTLFKKDLVFNRIKNFYYQAEYTSSFSLPTRQSTLVSDQITIQQILNEKIEHILQNLTGVNTQLVSLSKNLNTINVSLSNSVSDIKETLVMNNIKKKNITVYSLAQDISISNMKSQGYRVINDVSSSKGSSFEELNAIKLHCLPETILCAGGAATGSDNLLLVSCGKCHSVLEPTLLNRPVFNNGAYWYLTNKISFGFSPTYNIKQADADCIDCTRDEKGVWNYCADEKKLSWFLNGSCCTGVWRIGKLINLHSNHRRIIFLS